MLLRRLRAQQQSDARVRAARPKGWHASHSCADEPDECTDVTHGRTDGGADGCTYCPDRRANGRAHYCCADRRADCFADRYADQGTHGTDRCPHCGADRGCPPNQCSARLPGGLPAVRDYHHITPEASEFVLGRALRRYIEVCRE